MKLQTKTKENPVNVRRNDEEIKPDDQNGSRNVPAIKQDDQGMG